MKPAPLPRRGGGRLSPVVLFAFGVMGAGCYPKAGAAPGVLSANGVTWASMRWPGVTAGALSAGRDHFLAKCGGCHDYPDLVTIPERRWPDIVARMATKSALGAEERDAVLHYVLASRSEQAGR